VTDKFGEQLENEIINVKRRTILCSFGALGLAACGGGIGAAGNSVADERIQAVARAASAQSAQIGNANINFNLKNYAAYGMAVTDLAGTGTPVGTARTGYWNNLTCPSFSGETVQNFLTLVDDIGAPVSGMEVTITANAASGVFFGPDAVATPPLSNDPNLFASVMDQLSSGTSTMSITGIPYPVYDLYVYVRDDGSTRAGTIIANDITIEIYGGAGIPTATGSGYVVWTWPDTTLPANYAVFRGLSGNVTASFVANSIGSASPHLQICGFQIVREGAIPTPSSVPTAVTAAITAGNQESRLSWTAVPTATSYNIYRNGSKLTSVAAALTSYADTAVVNGTAYSYVVTAVNSVGEGPKSTAVSVTPAEPSFSLANPFNTLYQYSIPVTSIFSTSTARPADPMRRAYLWVPPSASRLQGVIFGLHNMLEKPFFADPVIRQACSNAGLGIVFISPGDSKTWTANGIANYAEGLPTTAVNLDPNEYTPTDTNPATGEPFANASEQAGAEMAVILQKLATESGFAELAYAPIMMVGHSAASPWLWTETVATSAALISRVFALISYKGFYPGAISAGLPVLHVSAEWQEISDWGNTWEVGDAPSLRSLRQANAQNLLGELILPGTGHYHYSTTQSAPIASYIEAVVTARIPANWPKTAFPTLKAVQESSGWLVGMTSMNSGSLTPYSYATWVAAGKNASEAYWYPDEATATAVCTGINDGFGRLPQMVNVYQNPAESTSLYNLMSGTNSSAGYVPWVGELLSDNVTFQIRATGLNQSPNPRLQHAGPVGVGQGPIQFLANGSGAVRQTGPDTFRIWMDRGSVVKAGQPWEPFVIAWHPGDSTYREADRPVQITSAVTVNLTSYSGGATQTVTFNAIPNQSVDAMSNITLAATSSAGSAYPVQFWVASGPYNCDNTTNSLMVPNGLPTAATYPMRVVVGAWQWGRPQVMQSATPVFNTFWLFQTKAQLTAWVAAGSPVNSSGVPVV
jgi:hypothetical protein